ncbi:hypothetical protein G5C60_28050 [Streptomyces sp. HC44]|uniref:Uncharacterized protein n=1 Tax=Streptomyces scabichelini TaxID=2711217 RepID=A0A6G4VB54_9ACTN|nr:hypothetical protein [Streptomyces scabichelini]NGO11352.1 hypothetical protein [Streptomyces scabichelini]
MARPEPPFEQDWKQRVHHLVGAYMRECGRPVVRLTRADCLASSPGWIRPRSSPYAGPFPSSSASCGSRPGPV